jgi:hypothetical protein
MVLNSSKMLNDARPLLSIIQAVTRRHAIVVEQNIC